MVKNIIYDMLLASYGFNEDNINLVIPFEDKEQLSSQETRFEIMMHNLQKKSKYNALSDLIQKYKLDKPKYIIEMVHGMITLLDEEINYAFKKEVKSLSFNDKLWVIVQRVYQGYKGFGVIDDIRDMNIDGVSGGVSGVPASSVYFGEDGDIYTEQMSIINIPKDYDSVWIFYKGKSIHLSFLSFGSELELKRVANNIYKY